MYAYINNLLSYSDGVWYWGLVFWFFELNNTFILSEIVFNGWRFIIFCGRSLQV